MTRLEQQIAFLLEADRLKSVLRQSLLVDASRRENSAEHSWHLALFAAVLVEHASEDVDLLRVLRMLIVHDLVEIDAGDTYAYDEEGTRSKVQRERAAADRLFRLLPESQAEEWRGLWDEFEARDTPDARFAAAVDRLQPVLLNHASGGTSWSGHGVSVDQVVAFNRHIEEGAPALWEHARGVIAAAAEAGYLRP